MPIADGEVQRSLRERSSNRHAVAAATAVTSNSRLTGGRVDGGAAAQQQPRRVQHAAASGHVQGGRAVLVGRVDRRPGLEQDAGRAPASSRRPTSVDPSPSWQAQCSGVAPSSGRAALASAPAASRRAAVVSSVDLADKCSAVSPSEFGRLTSKPPTDASASTSLAFFVSAAT